MFDDTFGSARRLKICIYGAGAIGGSIAVRLSQVDHADVCVIARGAQARAIQASGLTLVSGSERITARLPCTETTDGLAPQDIVFVCVKDRHLDAVADGLPLLLRPDTRVVFAMNGIPWWIGDPPHHVLPEALKIRLDPHGKLQRIAKRCAVAAGVVYSSNHMVEPGLIANTTPQRNKLRIGRPDNQQDPMLDALVNRLQAGGYDAAIPTDIRAEIWNKMLLFVSASPVCALTGADLQTTVNDTACRAIVSAAMREGLLLGRRLGFDLPDEIEPWLDLYRDKPVRPSMLEDFVAGREPELDSGILAFKAIAAFQGVNTPMLNALAALVDLKRVVRRCESATVTTSI